MQKRKPGIIIALCVVAALITGFTSPNGSTSDKNVNAGSKIQTENSKSTDADVNKMIATITKLSARSRHFGSDNEKKAFDELNNMFKACGFKPQTEMFKDEVLSENGGLIKIQSQNLIAVKKNTAKVNKGIIIICAHYDCGEDTTGANDDASGVSVVLETARLLNNKPNPYELRFVLFSGEECGCRGSLYYVNNLSEKDRKNIKAVIDVDSIAQKDMVNPKIFTLTGKENNATRLLKHPSGNQTLSVNKASKEISDYFRFDNCGIPALCIGQPYNEKLMINSSKDSISLIDKSKLKYVANIILMALRY